MMVRRCSEALLYFLGYLFCCQYISQKSIQGFLDLVLVEVKTEGPFVQIMNYSSQCMCLLDFGERLTFKLCCSYVIIIISCICFVFGPKKICLAVKEEKSFPLSPTPVLFSLKFIYSWFSDSALEVWHFLWSNACCFAASKSCAAGVTPAASLGLGVLALQHSWQQAGSAMGCHWCRRTGILSSHQKEAADGWATN